ncbi:Wobble nucleotide-excising tRNase [Methylomagnum ishizawai]|uniref:Wobble nucleotide-excising tRNase n=1 Tax=Methylomagnum ishizawai TaxID=1760988 RepID=A0A1Y6D2C6_9GAMM|nr:AAA family ATPase [Methylomagnum ishizawai]SMF96787.1 Wobble nucleotide-excising tRNase [Methylomagnum ishizawai]
MLKRITRIANIGRFVDSSCGGTEFSELSVIFGRNTYGKSTLSELLASLATNDITPITARRTIPNNNKPQEAKLAFKFPGDTKETVVSLQNSSWNYNGASNIKIAVFDDGFYHNNIFSARQFTRPTKEGLSAFILGAEGVKTAKIIADKKKQKGDKTRERNQLRQNAFPEIEDQHLPNFLNLTITETTDELQKRTDDLRSNYSEIKKQIQNTDKIKSRETCHLIGFNYNFDSFLDEINNTLLLSIESHHKEAQQQVLEHIEKHFTKQGNADTWIRQGLQQNNGESCQFCGQPLGECAKELISKYRESFDDAYTQHEDKVIKAIDNGLEKLSAFPASEIRLTLESNRRICATYHELTSDISYSVVLEKLDQHAINIARLIDLWEASKNNSFKILEDACRVKKQSPHKQITVVSANPISNIIQQLATEIDSYNDSAQCTNIFLARFKLGADTEKLRSQLQELEGLGKDARTMLDRAQKDTQVKRLKLLDEEIERLGNEASRLEKELKTQQSEYLKKFFVSLNKWFSEFGSKHFSLEMATNSSGHTPIYFLKVLFKGQVIPEKDLASIFSESDRRALALAVFWSYLSNLDRQIKESLIVVLDDPVTSFDSDRITAVHQEIIKLYRQVRQVIILSHYDVNVARLLSDYRNHPICLLTIEHSNNTSLISPEDKEEFIKSEHERKTRELMKFADGQNNLHNPGDLRIFLEAEISFRYSRQLQTINAGKLQLGEKIDGLFDKGFISRLLADEAHNWRECLNPSHHTWTTNDIEDQRRTVGRFMDFIYTSLCPHP